MYVHIYCGKFHQNCNDSTPVNLHSVHFVREKADDNLEMNMFVISDLSGILLH